MLISPAFFRLQRIDFLEVLLGKVENVVSECFVVIKTLTPSGTRTRTFCFPGSLPAATGLNKCVKNVSHQRERLNQETLKPVKCYVLL